MQSDTSYIVNMQGSHSDKGTLSDTYIYGIYDSNGTLINGTSNDDYNGTLESQVTFTPTEDGTYYISAGAYADLIGTYTLSIEADTLA